MYLRREKLLHSQKAFAMSIVIIPIVENGVAVGDARYRKGEFQLQFNGTIYSRKFSLEEAASSDPAPMFAIDCATENPRGFKELELIHIAVGEQLYVYGPARLFTIEIKTNTAEDGLELSSPYAIYLEGALFVEYRKNNYRVAEAMPLMHITDLTVGEHLGHRTPQELELRTPMGRRERCDYLEAESTSPKRRRTAVTNPRHDAMRPFAPRALELTRTALAAIDQLKALGAEMADLSFEDPHARLIDAEYALHAIQECARRMAGQ